MKQSWTLLLLLLFSSTAATATPSESDESNACLGVYPDFYYGNDLENAPVKVSGSMYFWMTNHGPSPTAHLMIVHVTDGDGYRGAYSAFDCGQILDCVQPAYEAREDALVWDCLAVHFDL